VHTFKLIIERTERTKHLPYQKKFQIKLVETEESYNLLYDESVFRKSIKLKYGVYKEDFYFVDWFHGYASLRPVRRFPQGAHKFCQ
jgi:hypothetical protein